MSFLFRRLSTLRVGQGASGTRITKFDADQIKPHAHVNNEGARRRMDDFVQGLEELARPQEGISKAMKLAALSAVLHREGMLDIGTMVPFSLNFRDRTGDDIGALIGRGTLGTWLLTVFATKRPSSGAFSVDEKTAHLLGEAMVEAVEGPGEYVGWCICVSEVGSDHIVLDQSLRLRTEEEWW